MSDANVLRIVVPGGDDGEVSGMLVALTKHLMSLGHDTSGGIFGGPFGYGAHYEDEVFLMHPFCWCEREGCPWCVGCYCQDDSESCAWCRGENPHAEKGALAPNEPPHYGAPHFWHKPSGLRIWWYKYIGRGQEMNCPEGVLPIAILAECIQHAKVAP